MIIKRIWVNVHHIVKEKRVEKKLIAHVIKQEEYRNFALDELLMRRIVIKVNESSNKTPAYHLLFKRFTSMWFQYQSFRNTKIKEFKLVETNRKGKSFDDIKKYKLLTLPLYDSQSNIKKKKV